jgi:hypothetical protein
MEVSKTLFFSSKFLCYAKKMASKFRDNLGPRPQKCLQSLSYDKIIAVCSMNIRNLKRSVSRKQYF